MTKTKLDKPRVLVNSLPKSGTNYMQDVLTNLSYQYSGLSLTSEGHERPFRPVKRLLRGQLFPWQDSVSIGVDFTRKFSGNYLNSFFNKIALGGYATGHTAFSSSLGCLLIQHNIKTITMIRHPIDVIRSYIRFARDNPKHLHHLSHRTLSNEQLVLKHIEGGELDHITVLPWSERLAGIAKWISHDQDRHVFCKYEDLVTFVLTGRRSKALNYISDFLCVSLDSLCNAVLEEYGMSRTYYSVPSAEALILSYKSIEMVRSQSSEFMTKFDYS